MQELPFLNSARRLILIDICMKFREDSLRGFQVTERTLFVTDRQTDGRPGKNNMSPNPKEGRHKKRGYSNTKNSSYFKNNIKTNQRTNGPVNAHLTISQV